MAREGCAALLFASSIPASSRAGRVVASAVVVATLVVAAVGVARAARAERAAASSATVPPLDVTSRLDGEWLGPHMHVLEDPSKALTLDDVRSARFARRFAPTPHDAPSFGIASSAFWVRFDVEGGDAGARWLLELQNPYLDHVDLYVPAGDGRYEVRRAGDALPFDARELDHRTFVFALHTDAGARETYYARIESAGSISIPLRAWTLRTFLVHRDATEPVVFMLYGLVLVLAAYNGCLFLMTRSRPHLGVAAGSAGYLFFQLTLDGTTFQLLLPGHPEVANGLMPVSILLCLACIGLEARFYLDVGRLLPDWDRLVGRVLGAFVALAVLSAFEEHGRAIRIALGAAGVLALGVALVGGRLARRGERTARVFLLACAFFVVGACIRILLVLGVLPENVLTIWGMPVGASIALVLLSTDLSHRLADTRSRASALNAQLSANLEKMSKAVVAAEAAARAKSGFLASVSHELRTPLNAIVNLPAALAAEIEAVRGMACRFCGAEYALDPGEEPRPRAPCPSCGAENALEEEKVHVYAGSPSNTRRCLTRLAHAGRHLLGVVDGMLDLTQLTSGHFEIRLGRVDVARLLHEAIDPLVDLAASQGVTLEVEAPPPGTFVEGDELRLSQVLINLVGNAIKFSGGKGTVRAGARAEDESLCFFVTDEGIGIAPEHRDAIFRRFGKLDAEGVAGYEGTGLGLSISKLLVELHGGELGVTSEVGRGSTFHFRIPRRPPPQRGTRATSAATAAAALLAVLCAPAGVRAQEPVRLPAALGGAPLGAHLALLEDPGGALAIDDVADPSRAGSFEPASDPVPGFGFTDSAVWARFEVANEEARDASFLLEFAHANTDHVDLYVPRAGGGFERRATGDAYPFARREIPYRTFLFALDAPAGSRVTYYVRVASEGSLVLPLRAWSELAFLEHQGREQRLLWAFFGILVVMGVSNLALFMKVRDRELLAFALYSAGYFLFQLTLNGYTFQYLLPNQVWLANKLSPFSIGLSVLAGSWVHYVWLDVETTIARYARMFRAMLWICGGAMLFGLVGPYRLSIRVVAALVCIQTALGLVTSVMLARRGSRPAQLYVLAWGAHIAGATLYALSAFGVLPEMFFTSWSHQIGVSFAAVLLSAGMAHRIETANAHVSELNARLAENLEATKAALLRAEQSARARGEFLATVSHELRTPLNAIINVPEALLVEVPLVPTVVCASCRSAFELDEGDVVDGSTRCPDCAAAGTLERADRCRYVGRPARTLKHLGAIERAGKRLLRVVNSILDFSTIEAGRLSLRVVRVDVEAVMKRAAARVADLAAAEATTLVMHAAPPGIAVMADETRLTEVLEHLLENAIKFGKRGQTVDLTARLEGAEVVIAVRDRGIGIRAADRERIFRDFEQLDQGDTRRYGGTGLGLTLARSIVELHGGRIEVASELGRGSTFSCRLPGEAAA